MLFKPYPTLVALFLTLLTACGGEPLGQLDATNQTSEEALGAPDSDSVDVTRGQRLYKNQCQGCHGPGGEGPTPLNLGEQSFDLIAENIEISMPMGNPGACTRSCAIDIAAFLVSLSGGQLPDSSGSGPSASLSSSSSSSSASSSSASTSSASTSSSSASSSGQTSTPGEALFQQLCSGCHLPSGGGPYPLFVNDRSYSAIRATTEARMPYSNPQQCDGQCAESIADYLVNYLPEVGSSSSASSSSSTGSSSTSSSSSSSSTGSSSSASSSSSTSSSSSSSSTSSSSNSSSGSSSGGQCQAPSWQSGSTYSQNAQVSNRGALYECLIPNWCSSAADWAYEPGGGLYWQEAWREAGQCDSNSNLPAAPSQVIAVASANGDRIGISWTDNANNETGFIISRASNDSSYSDIARVDADVVNYTDTQVTLSNSYRYQVSAVGDSGESPVATSNRVDLEKAATVPAAPGSLEMTQTEGAFRLRWLDNADNESRLTLYRSADELTWNALVSLSPDTVEYTDNSIIADQDYAYRVTAANDAGESSPSNSVHGRWQSVSGNALFNEKCIACHNSSGIGGDLLSSQVAARWEARSSQALNEKILTMPAQNCDANCVGGIADYLWLEAWGFSPADNALSDSSAGVRGVRLLSPVEYANTVADLMKIELPKDDLPRARFDGDFKYPTQVSTGVILVDHLREYQNLAERIAGELSLHDIGCEQSCTTEQLLQLAKKLFRRPLSTDEQQRYSNFHTSYGDRETITAFLQSPYFLYLVETGQWNAGEDSYALSSYEKAAHLAYRLWGTVPDDTLLSAADNNSLQTETQLRTQIARMMADKKFTRYFGEFIDYYTQTYAQLADKPGLDTSLITAMETERALAIQNLFTSGSGSITELFSPGYTFVNASLASHYGIAGIDTQSFQRVTTSEQRGGLLHQGLTQVHNSDFAATSLVKRGKMIRENMLCHPMGVPSGVDPETISMPDQPITTRERWHIITGPEASSGQCWQCHQLMNEPGSALEQFDQTGRYRTNEPAYNDSNVSLIIDASGVLRNNSGFSELTRYANARELADFMAGSEDIRSCFVDNYFRFTSGHSSDSETQTALTRLQENFVADGDIVSLVSDLLVSHMMLYRTERN